jgi:very-short-patch-repair endonuclease
VIEEHNLAKVTNARTLRKKSTDAERLLWKNLRRRQLCAYKFRRQQPIGAYIVDFVCLEKKLIIELDGGQHTEQVEYDEKRSAWLRELGYRVLRYWNHDVLKSPDIVLVNILEEIEKGK